MPDSHPPVRTRVSFASLALIFVVSGSVLADGTGWFTADQANLGRLAYAQRCATCHGAQLQGTGAPALTARRSTYSGTARRCTSSTTTCTTRCRSARAAH